MIKDQLQYQIWTVVALFLGGEKATPLIPLTNPMLDMGTFFRHEAMLIT